MVVMSGFDAVEPASNLLQSVFLNAGIDASEKRLPTRTVRRAAIHAAPLLDRFEHAAALALLNKWAGLAVGR
ncbi:hypothetical protein D3C76_1438160 [compost metagenome]